MRPAKLLALFSYLALSVAFGGSAIGIFVVPAKPGEVLNCTGRLTAQGHAVDLEAELSREQGRLRLTDRAGSTVATCRITVGQKEGEQAPLLAHCGDGEALSLLKASAQRTSKQGMAIAWGSQAQNRQLELALNDSLSKGAAAVSLKATQGQLKGAVNCR